jgi:hypothetical protein
LLRQSGGKIYASAIAAAGALAGLPAAAGQVNWAHQNGTLQSGGQLGVRTVNGAVYSATQNPGGAVAKANQSASTQPVTVQIQATGTQQQELRTFVRDGNGVFPVCPAGFTAVFQYTTNNCTASPVIFNAGGTRLSLGTGNNGGSQYYAFFADNNFSFGTYGQMQGQSQPSMSNTGLYCGSVTTGFVSAEICAK